MSIFKKIKDQKITIKYLDEDEIAQIDTEKIIEYKVLVVGDHLVGKSSLCLRFSKNEFNLEIKPTKENECYVKILKLFDITIKLYLIDTTNDLKKMIKNNNLFEDVKGIIVVYDITKIKSFENCKSWINEIRQNVNESIPFMLIGNKKDLKFLRNIDYEEAYEKANHKFNCDFKETSCIDLENVKDCIKLFVARIFYTNLNENEKQHYKVLFSDKGNDEGKEKEKKIENNEKDKKEENKIENNEKEKIEENKIKNEEKDRNKDNKIDKNEKDKNEDNKIENEEKDKKEDNKQE